jgi:hypothetical protein
VKGRLVGWCEMHMVENKVCGGNVEINTSEMYKVTISVYFVSESQTIQPPLFRFVQL